MKNTVLPISKDIHAEPITTESLGLKESAQNKSVPNESGEVPSNNSDTTSHITLSESLRNRIKNIRFASDIASDSHTHKSNKPL